nr:hypothetical protein BaRGS_032514 [Batillaria attramentaria]
MFTVRMLIFRSTSECPSRSTGDVAHDIASSDTEDLSSSGLSALTDNSSLFWTGVKQEEEVLTLDRVSPKMSEIRNDGLDTVWGGSRANEDGADVTS